MHNRAAEAAELGKMHLKKSMQGGYKGKEGGVVREGYKTPSPYLSQKPPSKNHLSKKLVLNSNHMI